MEDRPAAETSSINESSAKYYEHDDKREFWLNRPFSHPESAARHLTRFGQLLSMLAIREGDRVLDFGCGTGWTSVMLARMGADVVGMDIAPESLEIGRENARRELSGAAGEHLSFREYGGGRIDLEDGECDFVIVYDAFHHFPNPMGVLSEFERVLAPEGRFGFAEPGAGHAGSHDSVTETAHGILEQDLDLEQFYRSAMHAGFRDVELSVPALDPEVLTLPMNRMRSFLRGFSWLVPHDFVRKAVLMGPIGVFRKGRHAVTSLNPRSHAARIEPRVSHIEARPGEPIAITARVQNLSHTVWLREGRRGRGFVRLGAHLLGAAGAVVDNDYGRASIPKDMATRDACEIELRMTAPDEPGSYSLRLDMVNEGVCWFAQQGSVEVDVALDVQP